MFLLQCDISRRTRKSHCFSSHCQWTVGCNRNTKIWWQHQKAGYFHIHHIVQRASHEITFLHFLVCVCIEYLILSTKRMDTIVTYVKLEPSSCAPGPYFRLPALSLDLNPILFFTNMIWTAISHFSCQYYALFWTPQRINQYSNYNIASVMCLKVPVNPCRICIFMMNSNILIARAFLANLGELTNNTYFLRRIFILLNGSYDKAVPFMFHVLLFQYLACLKYL